MLEPKWRMWLEKDGVHVIGMGGFKILKAIEELGSISKACRRLGMSYKFVWNYLNRMERVLGERVVERERGGVEKGRTRLTVLGRELLRVYERYEKVIGSALKGVRGVVKEIRGDEVVLKLEDLKLNEGDEVILAPLKDP